MNRYLIILIFICISLINCKKDKIYSVPPEIQPYIDRFIAEGKARNQNIIIDNLVVIYEQNLNVDGLNAAGVCTFNKKNPHTIKLDTTSGNWQNNLSSREQLIFHELGHCVLERNHTSIKFESDNFKSIMKPSGEQLYGPNTTNFKRSYYLDELFNEATPPPSWASIALPYNTLLVKTPIFIEDFNDNANTWSLGNSTFTNRSISDGVLKFKSLSVGNYLIDKNIDIDQSKDFEIEMSIKFLGAVGTTTLYYGGSNNNNLSGFYLNQKGIINIGNILNGFEYAQTEIPILTNQFNKITFRKLGSNTFFYINEKHVDKQLFVDFFGNKLGIGINGEPTEIEANYFYINYID